MREVQEPHFPLAFASRAVDEYCAWSSAVGHASRSERDKLAQFLARYIDDHWGAAVQRYARERAVAALEEAQPLLDAAHAQEVASRAETDILGNPSPRYMELCHNTERESACYHALLATLRAEAEEGGRAD